MLTDLLGNLVGRHVAVDEDRTSDTNAGPARIHYPMPFFAVCHADRGDSDWAVSLGDAQSDLGRPASYRQNRVGRARVVHTFRTHKEFLAMHGHDVGKALEHRLRRGGYQRQSFWVALVPPSFGIIRLEKNRNITGVSESLRKRRFKALRCRHAADFADVVRRDLAKRREKHVAVPVVLVVEHIDMMMVVVADQVEVFARALSVVNSWFEYYACECVPAPGKFRALFEITEIIVDFFVILYRDITHVHND